METLITGFFRLLDVIFHFDYSNVFLFFQQIRHPVNVIYIRTDCPYTNEIIYFF